MQDIAEFLGKHDPFVGLDAAALERLAARTEIEYFEADRTIFRQGEGPPDAMWVVRTGAVELLEKGRVLDLLGPGEPFGHPWMLSGLPTGWEARARESSLCYRLAADDVIPQLADPAGLRSVARALMDRPRPGGASTLRAGSLDEGHETARSLLRKQPVLCEPNVSLREAAARMEDEGVSSVLVDLGDGELGIVTDRDLRSKVVAAGRSSEISVGEVMSAPVFTAAADQTRAELMLTMIDRGIRHVPVVSGSGQLLGVATDVDLLAAETRTPIMLRRTIADASDVGTLRETPAQVNSTLMAMHDAGVAATRISEILSVIVDALVRRVIELTIASVGPLPAELGWLSLGSFGRREAVPSSDLDSGMVWADSPDADVAGYMRRIGGRVVDELSAMGWQPDAHGVSATAAMSASSMEEWRRSIASWVEGPTPEPALVAISIVLDARTIYGPDGGLDVPALLREVHPRPQLLRLMLRLALARKPPTGFLRNIVVEHSGEHAGQFDIKRGGLLPVVNLARYAALAAEATTTSTVGRLRAGAEADILDATDAATLEEAFDLFSELRLGHQVPQLAAGEEPDNLIDPKTLNPLTRRYLRDAFRAVASVQRSLDTKLAWNT
jgi:CBS domain-containing protein